MLQSTADWGERWSAAGEELAPKAEIWWWGEAGGWCQGKKGSRGYIQVQLWHRERCEGSRRRWVCVNGPVWLLRLLRLLPFQLCSGQGCEGIEAMQRKKWGTSISPSPSPGRDQLIQAGAGLSPLRHGCQALGRGGKEIADAQSESPGQVSQPGLKQSQSVR